MTNESEAKHGLPAFLPVCWYDYFQLQGYRDQSQRDESMRTGSVFVSILIFVFFHNFSVSFTSFSSRSILLVYRPSAAHPLLSYKSIRLNATRLKDLVISSGIMIAIQYRVPQVDYGSRSWPQLFVELLPRKASLNICTT
jgi:hypothetical protein